METALPALAPRAESVIVGHLGDGDLDYNTRLDRCAAPETEALRSAVMDAIEDVVALCAMHDQERAGPELNHEPRKGRTDADLTGGTPLHG